MSTATSTRSFEVWGVEFYDMKNVSVGAHKWSRNMLMRIISMVISDVSIRFKIKVFQAKEASRKNYS